MRNDSLTPGASPGFTTDHGWTSPCEYKTYLGRKVHLSDPAHLGSKTYLGQVLIRFPRACARGR